MEIKVIKEPLKYRDVHGGAYATCEVKITVDSSLDPHEQRNCIIHEVIENVCLSWSHDKVNELEVLISDALDQLEENGSN